MHAAKTVKYYIKEFKILRREAYSKPSPRLSIWEAEAGESQVQGQPGYPGNTFINKQTNKIGPRI
jgi:hypothetical protein